MLLIVIVSESDGKGRRGRGLCEVKRHEQISWERGRRESRSGTRGEELVELRLSPVEVVLMPFCSRRELF